MWTADTMNDLYEVAEQDDKWALLYKGNESCFLSIKTPVGPTKRIEVNKAEMQGSTWGPLKCSVQMDQIGKESLEKNENVFTYKESVKIPPLAFVDDVLAVSECGQPSINVNVAINAKIGIECWEVPPNTCWKIQ